MLGGTPDTQKEVIVDTTIMSAAEIAAMDEELAKATAEMWQDPLTLAKQISVPIAARFGVEEAAVEMAAAHYISVLARNAESEYVPPPRYNHADIVADAYASAAAGLEGYTPTPWE